MEDLQSQKDSRGIPLEFVGIKQLKLPFLIENKKKKSQHISASINFYASLSHDTKGHHLSRFVEMTFRKSNTLISFKKLKKFIRDARKKLDAENVYIEIEFGYFIPKQSPVSKKWSMGIYNCKMVACGNSKAYSQKLILGVPLMLLCPCSKAISKYNAHNQRSLVTVDLSFDNDLYIEDLVNIIEKEGSCEIYPLLKRVDEKYVTEVSYENPKFVEDVVRDISLKMKEIQNVTLFTVECESYESIHNHNAYAKYTNFQIQPTLC